MHNGRKQPYLIQARDENGIDVSVLSDGLVECLGVAERFLEHHGGCLGPEILVSADVKEALDLNLLHKVCWGITNSECGESLEWQRNRAGASYDEGRRKREDFVLK